MNKKREGLFGFSKKEKKQDRILEDLGLYKEKSKNELTSIIIKVKHLIQENKKLKNNIATLEDAIFRLENENLLLREDIQTVVAKNVNMERFEPENFDLRILVASLEKENFTLKTKLLGKSGKVLPSSPVRAKPKLPITKRMVKEVLPSGQVMKGPEPPGIRRVVEEVLPPGQVMKGPEPPGIRRAVEEVLPPGQAMKEPEPPGIRRVVEEVQLPPSHIPEEFEPSVIEDIIEELLPPSQVPEGFNPPLEENEIGEEWSLNQIPEEFEVPMESEENIIYDERKGLMIKQEEISNIKIHKKRRCPKCGNEKRAFISELDDKTNIIMQSPRFYGKKFRCNICATEWN
ncbi:hypothetical protein LCGC14_1298500 [marine sediment metagenome]|uniref:Uncharacterized protein n=1 Tax=marine sediment metagenome TaxID=412755 RepID=A0A0F9NT86_9ZZZZ